MAIVFLPLLEEKAFICFQNPFKGLYSPETAHAKHKTHSHLNLPIEEKAIKFIKSIKAFFFKLMSGKLKLPGLAPRGYTVRW